MKSDEPPMVGQLVARYRKTANMSAEELAAASGMTRSVVANLENGRKEDISVKQLIALANALGVSPVFLMVDIEDPAGAPEFTVDSMPGNRREYDFVSGTWVDRENQFRNYEAVRWIGGHIGPAPALRNDVQRRAFGALDSVSAYTRSFQRWLSLAIDIDTTRRQRVAEPELFSQEQGQSFLDYAEERIEDDAEDVAEWVRKMQSDGIVISNTASFVTEVMQRLGFNPPEFGS